MVVKTSPVAQLHLHLRSQSEGPYARTHRRASSSLESRFEMVDFDGRSSLPPLLAHPTAVNYALNIDQPHMMHDNMIASLPHEKINMVKNLKDMIICTLPHTHDSRPH